MANILITCFGSYGDLHPYIALAKNLQDRGHEVSIGSSIIFRVQIESEKIQFIHLRSSLDQYETQTAIRNFMKRIFDPVRGGELMINEMMENIEDTYLDTLKATEKNDIVISNPLSYVTPIVCRDKNIPWLSTILAPMFFLSVYDPPIMSPAPWLQKIHRLSPFTYRLLFSVLKGVTKKWTKPLNKLCSHYQIPPPNGNPLFEGQYSPYGTLAMFSKYFAEPQVDWPINTTLTGFPLFSVEMSTNEKLDNLQAFISAGEAPIVFVLGSSAVNIADDFYSISADISRKLNKRAVLVYGEHDDSIEHISPGNDLFFINYVSYEKIFPQASLIVHQGGIGTLAHSMAAQHPLLIVPFGFDQFDNGQRIEKLGIGKYLPRKKYTVKEATPVIKELLVNKKYKIQAQIIGKKINLEQGVDCACDTIELLLRNKKYDSTTMD
ncbi:MAG: glycosyltransferase [Gammaproteobacteria bacterium]|nr:glycosyltransferase [Gammaproteobacteria bacterium]